MTAPVVNHRSSGSGPVLVAVHGVGCTLAFWEDVIPLLDGSFTCVAVDVPGFGRSPAPAGAVTVAGLAATLQGWLVDAGLDRVVVMGHSLGGMIAQELAIADPARVRGLVLCCTIPAAGGAAEQIGGLADLAEQAGAEALTDAMAPAMLGPAPMEGTERARTRFRADFASAGPVALAAALRAITGFDARSRLGALAAGGMPAMVLAGEHEGNRADQQQLANLLGVPLVALPGTNHLAPAEAPHALVAAVMPFLDGLRDGDTWQ